MYRCRMKPYEGNAPYIFISYAHKDSDQVLPILDELADRGYRVWYDDGIAPGSEWPEYIATHLASSGLVLAFISPNSIASSNCRREVTFALAQNKPFVGIYLCETQMSPGMEMQLSAQQCIMKYALTEESFYSKLCSVQDIIPCRAEMATTAQPEETPAPPPGLTPEDMDALGVMHDAVEGAKRPAKTKGKKEKKEPKTPGKRKKLPLIIAAVVAVVLAVMFLIRGNNVHVGDQSISKNANHIRLEHMTLGSSEVNNIAKLKNLGALYLTDCQITGDLSKLKCLPALNRVEADDCSFSDLSFLQDAPNLYYLILKDCGVTDEAFPDLGCLEKVQLINLNGNPDFSAISKLPLNAVTELRLSGTAVSDFAPIAALEKLTALDISSTGITQTADPVHSLRLKSLSIDGLKLPDLDAFSSITILESFSARDCGLCEIPIVARNSETLDKLKLDENPLSKDAIASLASCANLKELTLSGAPLDDLGFAASLTSLTKLHAAGCGLTSASGIGSCTELKELNLAENKLTEIDLSTLLSLDYLDLHGNSISDLSDLPAIPYDTLQLQGNPIDPATLPASTEIRGQALVMDYVDGLEDAPALANWSFLYVIGCPLDKQLALEKVGSSIIHHVGNGVVEEAIETARKQDGYHDHYHWKSYITE